MRYAGTRNPRAESNPLRSIPLIKSVRSVFGPSARDRLVGDVRLAEQFRESWAREYVQACASLGRANRTMLQYRRDNQRAAMRQLNAVRTGMKANLRAIAKAEAALLAYDTCPYLPGLEPRLQPGQIGYVPSGPTWLLAAHPVAPAVHAPA